MFFRFLEIFLFPRFENYGDSKTRFIFSLFDGAGSSLYIHIVKNIRIYEVGISYYGRTYDEGKKIGWRDGFRAIFCILKYNLFVR